MLLRVRRDARDVELSIGQDRSQVHLAGDLDQRLGLLLVLDARQVDDNRVALSQNLRLSDAEAVDSLTDSFDGQVETRRVERADRLLGDRDATLQVKSERGRIAIDQRRGEPTEGDHQDADERIEQLLAHYLEGSSADVPSLGSILLPRPDPSSLGTALSPADVSTLRCRA